jgi:hypothetical protein
VRRNCAARRTRPSVGCRTGPERDGAVGAVGAEAGQARRGPGRCGGQVPLDGWAPTPGNGAKRSPCSGRRCRRPVGLLLGGSSRPTCRGGGVFTLNLIFAAVAVGRPATDYQPAPGPAIPDRTSPAPCWLPPAGSPSSSVSPVHRPTRGEARSLCCPWLSAWSCSPPSYYYSAWSQAHCSHYGSSSTATVPGTTLAVGLTFAAAFGLFRFSPTS